MTQKDGSELRLKWWERSHILINYTKTTANFLITSEYWFKHFLFSKGRNLYNVFLYISSFSSLWITQIRLQDLPGTEDVKTEATNGKGKLWCGNICLLAISCSSEQKCDHKLPKDEPQQHAQIFCRKWQTSHHLEKSLTSTTNQWNFVRRKIRSYTKKNQILHVTPTKGWQWKEWQRWKKYSLWMQSWDEEKASHNSM